MICTAMFVCCICNLCNEPGPAVRYDATRFMYSPQADPAYMQMIQEKTFELAEKAGFVQIKDPSIIDSGSHLCSNCAETVRDCQNKKSLKKKGRDKWMTTSSPKKKVSRS